MTVKVVKVQHNRLAAFIYLPREAVRQFNLKKGDPLLLETTSEAIIVQPIKAVIKTPPEAPATSDGFKEEAAQHGGEKGGI